MAKFYLYDIVNVDATVVEQSKWDNLYERMQVDEWGVANGRRIGVVRSLYTSNTIAGYFANEGRKRAVWYDDNKEEIEPTPFYSFEHLFFVLFLDTAQILIQSRNIYDFVDLGLPVMRRNLLLHLTDLFRYANIYVTGRGLVLEEAGSGYSREELYLTFTSLKTVSELEISGLFGAKLPQPGDPKYRLFNPKEEWEPITWGAVADTLKMGLDAVKLSSIEDENATLKAPIPKALAAVGAVDKIKGVDQEGRLVIRQRKEETDLEVELPANLEVTDELVLRIVEGLDAQGRVEKWEAKREDRFSGNGDDLHFSE